MTMEVTKTVSRYTVTAATPGVSANSGYIFDIYVELSHQMNGVDRWVVRRLGYRLHNTGRWDYEPEPLSRTTRWTDTHSFTLEKALKLAETAAQLIVVNGHYADGTRAR